MAFNLNFEKLENPNRAANDGGHPPPAKAGGFHVAEAVATRDSGDARPRPKGRGFGEVVAPDNFRIGPVIAARTEKVMALFDHLRGNPESALSAHSRFILSLENKCKIYTCGGILGGALYDLSEKQVAYLDSLHVRLAKISDNASTSANHLRCR